MTENIPPQTPEHEAEERPSQKLVTCGPLMRKRKNSEPYTQQEELRSEGRRLGEASEVVHVPGTSMRVLFDEVPAFEVNNKVWYDRSHLDQDSLVAALQSGHPQEKENPTLIFLLGPKACGKSTFLRVHKQLLHDKLRLNESHCHVDYEFLRKSHRGYNCIVRKGLEQNVVYAAASKALKRQFSNWKLQTTFDCALKKLDLIVTDNRGKKLNAIVDRLKCYNVHVVFMFISFRECLSRQCKRAKEEGRSIKLLKYCKLMQNLKKVFQRAEDKPGHIIIVDNEKFQCRLVGMYDRHAIDDALKAVYSLHEQYNNFPFDLFLEDNWDTIRRHHIPRKYHAFL